MAFRDCSLKLTLIYSSYNVNRVKEHSVKSEHYQIENGLEAFYF